MRSLTLLLLPFSLSIAQAAAGSHHRRRNWDRRQEISTSDDDSAICTPQTVTETVQQTVTVTAAGGVGDDRTAATVTVTMTAMELSNRGELNARKFEGLSFITTTQVETIFATAAAETLTVVQPASTVTEIVTQAVTMPAVTLVQTVTEAGVAPPPVTITETAPQVPNGGGNAPSTNGTRLPTANIPNGVGVGVSTVPIPGSLLPTTTFGSDPMATSAPAAAPPPVINTSKLFFSSNAPAETTQSLISSEVSSAGLAPTTVAVSSEAPASSLIIKTSAVSEVSSAALVSEVSSSPTVSEASSSSVVESTSEAVITSSAPPSTVESVSVSTTTEATSTSVRTLESAITMVPTPTTVDASNPGSTLNLGGLNPDATAGLESAVTGDPGQTPVPDLADSPILSLINLSDMTFGSELDLGNLLGARATGMV